MSLSSRPHVGHLDSLAPETRHLHDHSAPLPATTKVARRESRLSLRSLFGRSRASKEADAPSLASHGESEFKIPAYRASVADLSHWPGGNGSDAGLDPESSPSNSSVTILSAPTESSKTHAAPKTPKDGRGTVADWSMPPLFKAFPQSICHITLPAATMSAETILRINEKKHTLLNEAALSTVQDGDKDKDKDKKKHRHNLSTSADSLEWTTKTYVLVTSGYVLQYAGSGPFDRLPEKALRLGPCSAAFATDAIPGRHWVLNVSSTAEADGNLTHDSRSLLSKLSFRVERRNTCNLLMVFESGDAMEVWIDALRTEIEKLGGKKKLSETGQPQTSEKPHSQRTLITRGTSRLGSCTCSQRGAGAEFSRGHSIDEESTSNSALSHEEHQLEKLRESSQRLSVMSSSQRTMFSSNGSSLDVSPTCENFSSLRIDEEPSLLDPQVEDRAWSRPMTPDIVSRHQSMQAAGYTGMRPLSRGPMLSRGDGVASPVGSLATPNFSLPNSSSRRFSRTRLVPRDLEAPPSAWRANRTLSMVADEAAPRVAPPERPSTSHYKSRQTLPTKMASEPRLRSTFYAPQRAGHDEVEAHYQASQLPANRPRAYRVSVGAMSYGRQTYEAAPSLRMPAASRDSSYVARQRSSFLVPPGSRSRSVEACRTPSRISINSVLSDDSGRHVAAEARATTPTTRRARRTPSHYASITQLRKEAPDKGLVVSKSLPHLAEGPPPAPPPTRALPPLPQNLKA